LNVSVWAAFIMTIHLAKNFANLSLLWRAWFVFALGNLLVACGGSEGPSSDPVQPPVRINKAPEKVWD